MKRIALKRRGPGDDTERASKRSNTSGSGPLGPQNSSRPDVSIRPQGSGRPSPPPPPTRPTLPPPPPARLTSAAAPPKQSSLPTRGSRSQDKGKGVAPPSPPSSELEPAVLMSLPEHLRAAVNLMSQDYTVANWTELGETDWLEVLKGLFSSTNSMLFSLAHILEPASAARNLETGLRVELVALKAEYEKVRWEKKKAEDILERGKVKMGELINARDVLQAQVKDLEDKRQSDQRMYARELSKAIADYKKSPAFASLLHRAVSDFKSSPEMKILIDEAAENGVRAWKASDEYAAALTEVEVRGVEAWKGSGDFAAAIAEAEARRAEAWKGFEEFATVIAKAEAQGADDLQFTISSIRPDIDLGFLFEAPSTPLPSVENLEVPVVVDSATVPVDDAPIPVVIESGESSKAKS